MLRSIRNDLVYLLGILNSIGKIKIYSEKYVSPEEFYKANNQLNFNACLSLLVNIGECANKLSDELKLIYPETEWKKIIGLRNKVVHDYTGLDLLITYEVIKSNLPKLEKQIIDILVTELKKGNFEREEYNIAKQSEFYRFIDFNKINLKSPEG